MVDDNFATSNLDMRALPTFLAVVFTIQCGMLLAQRMDSVHVYGALERRPYTTASANALAWRLHRERAPHVTLQGEELGIVREGMARYSPIPHRPGTIDDLTHLAMLFSNGRPVVMGVTGDLGRLINFTARKEYRIASFSEHLQVRAVLLELLMRH